MKKQKPIIEIKVNSWNKRTPYQQDKAFMWLHSIMDDLVTTYRKTGIGDDYWGKSE